MSKRLEIGRVAVRRAGLSWVLALGVLGGVLAKEGQAQQVATVQAAPQVTVTGEAVVYVTPDEAIINFGVSQEDADLDKAIKAVEERSTNLLRELRRLDLKEEQIGTANLNISPNIDYQNRKAGVVSYTVRRGYTVTLKKVPEFEKLIQAALKAGANELVGFEFRSSKMREKRDEARVLACKAAKEKAELLAKSLNMGLGRPITITEEATPEYSGRATQNVYVRESGEGSDDTSLPTGQIPMRARVTVSFGIE